MKDFAVGCCGSEERELQGSFLCFKIYSPNQKLAFGWKCSVNDVMKLSPLRCCDLSRSSGVTVEQEKTLLSLSCVASALRICHKNK